MQFLRIDTRHKFKLVNHLPSAIPEQKSIAIVSRILAHDQPYFVTGRWIVEGTIDATKDRSAAVREWIERNKDSYPADILAKAEWDGTRPLVVDTDDGYCTTEYAIAETSLRIV